MEEKFFTALENSYTSVFRVINTSPAKGLIFLKDVLNPAKNIRLTDLGMSQTGNTALLLFTRILPFEDMNITSGMLCAFKASAEIKLIRQYEQHREITNVKDESMDKFIFFYNVYKNIGTDIRFQKV